MATEVRWRRGTTAENDNFTGAEGEITVDMDKKGLRVHDNATQGGHPSLTEEAAHEAGYAYQVDSVSDLQSGSFPASLKRLWLAGYSSKGDGGHGPLYKTTGTDNGYSVFVDADGNAWARFDQHIINANQGGGLADAIDNIGSDVVTLVVDDTQTISDDLTIPENIELKFSRNGIIEASDGTETLTINGSIDAGLWQVFGDSLSVAGSPLTNIAYPEWAGGNPNDENIDCGEAINKLGKVFRQINLSSGNYNIDTPIDLLTDNSNIQKILGVGASVYDTSSDSNRGSCLIANTNGYSCIEMAGSLKRLQDFCIVSPTYVYSPVSYTDPTPSTIGITTARTENYGVAKQFVFDNIQSFMHCDESANNGNGTVGVYNIAGELHNYIHVRFIGDIGYLFTGEDSDDYGLELGALYYDNLPSTFSTSSTNIHAFDATLLGGSGPGLKMSSHCNHVYWRGYISNHAHHYSDVAEYEYAIQLNGSNDNDLHFNIERYPSIFLIERTVRSSELKARRDTDTGGVFLMLHGPDQNPGLVDCKAKLIGSNDLTIIKSHSDNNQNGIFSSIINGYRSTADPLIDTTPGGYDQIWGNIFFIPYSKCSFGGGPNEGNIFMGEENYGIVFQGVGSEYQTEYINENRNNWDLGIKSPIKMNSGGDNDITGIVPYTSSQRITFFNAETSYIFTFKDQDDSSDSANQIITGSGTDKDLAPGGTVELIYDEEDSKWRIINHYTP